MDNVKQITQQKLKDEVLRKIGSNLLLFQQIEGLLKLILRGSHVQGTVSNLMKNQEKRMNGMQGNMMGQLVRQYDKEILSESNEDHQEPSDLSETWMSFSFKTIGDNAFYENQYKNLEMVLKERNELVHAFLPRWRPDSPEQLTDASAYLDKQRARVLPVWEHLVSVAKGMHNIKQMWGSNEGNQIFEQLWLQRNPLISLLHKIASQIARTDGWACLAHAGKLAHEREPYEVANMKETYGYSTFKKLLSASEEFEILDEPLPNEGFRTFYRTRKV